MTQLKTITSCEVCDSTDLVPVLDLGDQPMCDDLVPIGNNMMPISYPLRLVACPRCITIHQAVQVEKRILFPQTYHYRAALTQDVLDGMRELLELCPDVSLALSLHATGDRERSQLMPINRRWPIADILSFLRDFYAQKAPDRSLLVQYTVIRGVNDSARHAAELVQLLAGLPVKLNLIPLNEVEPSRFRGPEPQSLASFRDAIHAAGMRVMVRYSKGQDIEAACGQLVIKHQPLSETETARA